VNPADGSVGNALTASNWYDGSGNLIKSIAAGAGKVHTKHVYDGLGRTIRTCSGYDTSDGAWQFLRGVGLCHQALSARARTPVLRCAAARFRTAGRRNCHTPTSETSYADAGTVSGDTILGQSEMTYDAAGNVTLMTGRQRLHDATGTGELSTISGSQPRARVSFLAMCSVRPRGRWPGRCSRAHAGCC